MIFSKVIEDSILDTYYLTKQNNKMLKAILFLTYGNFIASKGKIFNYKKEKTIDDDIECFLKLFFEDSK